MNEANSPLSSEDPAWWNARPIVVASRCLGFAECRWNGVTLTEPFVELMRDFVDFITPCPEFDIGLGVPRRPVRLVAPEGTKGPGNREERGNAPVDVLLIQPATEHDCTAAMKEMIETFFQENTVVDGFLLKFHSPSCGPNGVKVYKGAEKSSHVLFHTAGMFAAAARERFPDLPLEDEGRLKNFVLRERWLTRLYAAARIRAVRGEGQMSDLVELHSRYKYLLMAFQNEGVRELGRIVASGSNRSWPEAAEQYEPLFMRVLSRSPDEGHWNNVFQHMMGHFSEKTEPHERQYFLDLLEDFRRGGLPLVIPARILQSWAIRCQDTYIGNQALLRPYPDELHILADSGKGRDLK